MKFTNAIICLVATASTVTAQEQVACAGFECRSPENFPGGFDFKNAGAEIPQINTINDIQSPEAENVFVSEYVAITDSGDLGTVFPVNLALIGAQNAKPTGGAPVLFGDESRSLLGTQFYTNGNLFNSVVLDEQSEIDARVSNSNVFVGGRVVSSSEPETATQGFTFRGQCTVVSDQVKLTSNKSDGGDIDQFFAQISGHTCLYDMCFGGSNCILIYSGTPFVFDIRSGELPPGFSGFVAGGTGTFAGIGGSVDILTVTGRTTIGAFTPDALIGDATIFPAPLAGTAGGSFNEQNGEITQKIFLTTNQRLPPVTSN